MTKPDGYDRLSEKLDARAERLAGNLADKPGRTIGKAVAIVIGIILVLTVITSLIGWAGGWFDSAKQVVSAQNHRTQSYDVRQNWNSLIAAAQNACEAQGTGTQTGDANRDPVIVGGDPSFAYAQTYRNIRTNYNRAQDNPYENGVINAGGFPKHVPVFKEEMRKPIDWCAVQTDLTDMHR